MRMRTGKNDEMPEPDVGCGLSFDISRLRMSVACHLLANTGNRLTYMEVN